MLAVLYTRPAAAVWHILFTKCRSHAHYLGTAVPLSTRTVGARSLTPWKHPWKTQKECTVRQFADPCHMSQRCNSSSCSSGLIAALPIRSAGGRSFGPACFTPFASFPRKLGDKPIQRATPCHGLCDARFLHWSLRALSFTKGTELEDAWLASLFRWIRCHWRSESSSCYAALISSSSPATHRSRVGWFQRSQRFERSGQVLLRVPAGPLRSRATLHAPAELDSQCSPSVTFFSVPMRKDKYPLEVKLRC